MLIEDKNLDEDKIYDYFVENFIGDSLLAVADKEMIKTHYHTNEPWKVLEHCASLGKILRHRRREYGPSVPRPAGLRNIQSPETNTTSQLDKTCWFYFAVIE